MGVFFLATVRLRPEQAQNNVWAGAQRGEAFGMVQREACKPVEAGSNCHHKLVGVVGGAFATGLSRNNQVAQFGKKCGAAAADHVGDVVGRLAGIDHLIEQLNRMFAQLAADHAPYVHHANLQGTIAGLHPGNPREGWEDDLHPKTASFYWLARRVDDTIRQAVAALAAREQAATQGLG